MFIGNVIYPPIMPVHSCTAHDRVSISLRVGFCVVLSNRVGNARASMSRTDNGYRLPRFSYDIYR